MVGQVSVVALLCCDKLSSNMCHRAQCSSFPNKGDGDTLSLTISGSIFNSLFSLYMLGHECTLALWHFCSMFKVVSVYSSLVSHDSWMWYLHVTKIIACVFLCNVIVYFWILGWLWMGCLHFVGYIWHEKELTHQKCLGCLKLYRNWKKAFVYHQISIRVKYILRGHMLCTSFPIYNTFMFSLQSHFF